MIAAKDREVIRALAERWMELAHLPVMAERKRLWKAVHDLRAERPVILVGQGVKYGKATRDLLALAERLQTPVTCSSSAALVGLS